MKQGIKKALKKALKRSKRRSSAGKIQMIKNMYDLGIPLETIAKASKLSLHEIEHILG